MSRAWCNLHALLGFMLVLAGCNKDSESDRPAPTGGGTTDIFASPRVDAGAAAPVASGASDAASPADTCTVDGGPGCPMLRFMKGEVATAYAGKKGAELATTLTKLAASAPAGYTNWASISRDGAAAAKAGEFTAVKASCRGCHDQYKAKYVAEHRGEALH